MSCCGHCGSSCGCSCNKVGCFGQALNIVGHLLVIAIMVGVFMFIAPGLIYHYAAGSYTDETRDFVEFAINDKRTWVVSAAVWIGLAIWQFHRVTRPTHQKEAAPAPKRNT